MSSFNINIPANIAQNTLRRASVDMDKSMERISTGKRINAGSDDPAGLTMSTRIKSGSLTERQAASNANDVIAMVQGYSKIGRVIVDILSEMKNLAQKASNQIYDVNQRFEMDNHFNVLGKAWFSMAANASYNNGVTRMNTFTNSFVTRLGGGGDNNSITLTFKNWNPADSTANQNIPFSDLLLAGSLRCQAFKIAPSRLPLVPNWQVGEESSRTTGPNPGPTEFI